MTDSKIFADITIIKILKYLTKFFRKIILTQQDYLIILVHRKVISNAVQYLRLSNIIRLEQLVDIAIVDHVSTKNRFRLNYIFLSHHYKIHFILNTVTTSTKEIQSLSSVFNSATWLEREAFDMFGVLFNNNPDMRRILSDYGFSGHPLKKDFPLTGFKETYYSDMKKRLVPMAVELTQEYRIFE